jgi:hypothetical protein
LIQNHRLAVASGADDEVQPIHVLALVEGNHLVVVASATRVIRAVVHIEDRAAKGATDNHKVVSTDGGTVAIAADSVQGVLLVLALGVRVVIDFNAYSGGLGAAQLDRQTSSALLQALALVELLRLASLSATGVRITVRDGDDIDRLYCDQKGHGKGNQDDAAHLLFQLKGIGEEMNLGSDGSVRTDIAWENVSNKSPIGNIFLHKYKVRFTVFPYCTLSISQTRHWLCTSIIGWISQTTKKQREQEIRKTTCPCVTLHTLPDTVHLIKVKGKDTYPPLAHRYISLAISSESIARPLSMASPSVECCPAL